MGESKRFLTKSIFCDFGRHDRCMVLQRFDLQLNMVEDSAHSILAMVAGVLVPVFSPLGLGDWRIVTSLISGFMAKEV